MMFRLVQYGATNAEGQLMFHQAAKIIKKFGGAGPLSRAIKKHRSVVHRWTYPEERGGTGGLIPTQSLSEVLEAAEILGINITPEDLKP